MDIVGTVIPTDGKIVTGSTTMHSRTPTHYGIAAEVLIDNGNMSPAASAAPRR